MEFCNASEMLASVLKDMNEIINVTEPDKPITESYNGYELLPNDEETMAIHSESVEDKLIPEKIVHNSEFPAALKSDRNGSYTAEPFANGDQDNEDAKKYPSSKPEGHYSGMNYGTTESGSPLVARHKLESQIHSTSLGLGSMKKAEPKNETTDQLHARLIQLQKQVNAQAQRIAELEQKRRHPLNTVLGNVASLDKLDLLAEVSKQQFQIAALENAKRELEMQVEYLLRQLSLYHPDLDLNQLKANHLGFDIANGLGSENNEQGGVTQKEFRFLDNQNSNQFSELDQLKYQQHSPLLIHNNLASSRSHMLSSTNLPVSSQQVSRQIYFEPSNDNSHFLQTGLSGNNQYKSISLNELRHHRIHQMEANLMPRVPKPIDWMENGRGYTAFSCESPYTLAYASPTSLASQGQSLSVRDRLPPQYAGNYHRQAFLNNRVRSPPPNRTNDRVAETRRETTSKRFPSDNMSISMESSTHSGVNQLSPGMRRITVPLPVSGDLRNFPTPPVGRRMLPASPNRFSGAESVPFIPGTSPGDSNDSVVHSRFKRLLAATSFNWFSRHRNSTYSNHAITQPRSLELRQPKDDRSNIHPMSAPDGREVDLLETNESHSSFDIRHKIPSIQPNGQTERHIDSHVSTPPRNSVTRETVSDFGLGQARENLLNQLDNLTDSTGKSPCANSDKVNKSDLMHESASGFDTPPISLPTKPENGYKTQSDNTTHQPPFRFSYPTRDFVHWDKDMVSAWLYELGLGYSVPHVRRWLQNGSDLVHASRKEIEQEMGIRNPMHMKKLYLHLQLRTNEQISIYSSVPFLRVKYPVDFSISAWLDDLGLSSYTTAFETAAIDLLVLNHLTTDDLTIMKITSELHFLSLRRGLQMLRRMNYDLSQICRRPGDLEDMVWSLSDDRKKKDAIVQEPNTSGDTANDEKSKEVNSMDSAGIESSGDVSTTIPINGSRSSLSRAKRLPLHVCYWSQYRVMAWLHQIELPEYAPELCGSGVHGALMVLEDRFTVDLLANILHIPPNKTLVRRHLANKFAELVGEYILERKQEVHDTPDIAPLTTHSKNKITRKRGLFSTHRKHKSSLIEEELVCPVDIDSQHAEFFEANNATMDRTLSTPTESTSIQPPSLRETDL